MKNFTSVYTGELISTIRKKARGAIAVFTVCTVGFIAFCCLFCVLAARELLGVYLCAAFNVVATLAYLWYCYLFFAVTFVPTRRDARFVKNLPDVLPVTVIAEFRGTDGQGMGIFDGALKPLGCAIGFGSFTQGVKYELKTAQNNIIGYREVSHE